MRVRKLRHQWGEDRAIFRQLMDAVVARILDETYPEGQMLPSVRQLASDFDVNPLTSAKAYNELARDGLIQPLRGEGFVVARGARESLLMRERSRFLKEEWPGLRERLRRLDIDLRLLAETAEE